MAYFNKDTDIRDDLLKTLVSDSDVAESTDYVDALAQSYGVNPACIATPVPFEIKTIAMTYALITCAENASMMAGDGGEDGADAYELKRRVLAKKLIEFEKRLRPETFTGGGTSAKRYPHVFRLRRE